MTARSLADDEADLERHAEALIGAVADAIGPWVEAAVDARHGGPVPAEVAADAASAATEAAADVVPRLRDLLALDIDEQWTNPLAIIRTAVAYPTAVLRRAGVPPIQRDTTDAALHPDDVYGLTPAAFGDLGPAVHEPGLIWGAAKAHVHLRRRREDPT